MLTTRRFLLTGAGFTRNFGGFLAHELSSMVLSNPELDAAPRVQALLRDRLDLEDVYHEVMQTGSPEEQERLARATLDAYRDLDDVVRTSGVGPNPTYPLNIYGVQQFLQLFSGASGIAGFVFTLNQDLLLERRYYRAAADKPMLPGLEIGRNWFTTHFEARLGPDTACEVPRTEAVAAVRARDLGVNRSFWYVKLHGSCNWYQAGSTQMVIGRNKEEQIARHPLLSWYLDLLRDCLNAGDARLFVCGYGFQDPHINRILAEAIRDSGLSLYLLYPGEAKQVIGSIPDEYRQAISGAVKAYYPRTLRDVFPENQEESVFWAKIRTGFFGQHPAGSSA